MNFTPLISIHNKFCFISLMWVLSCVNIQLNAQSTVNPEQLRKKISSFNDNPKKVELLLDLSTYYLTKPGEFKIDLGQASQINSEAKTLSKTLDYKPGIGKALLLDAQIHRESGDSKYGFKRTNEAMAFAKSNHLDLLAADIYRELCAYKGYEKVDFEEKIKYLELAIPLYKKNNALRKEADALKDAADYYGIIEQSQKSLSLLEEALVIYRSIGYKELQGVYTLMSGNYGFLQNEQMALRYALLAEKTAEDVNDNSYQWCTIYNHLGVAYYDLSKYDLAFYNYEKALNIALENKNHSDINTISYNLAYLYSQQKKYDKALQTLKRTESNSYVQDEMTRIRRLFIFVMCYSKTNRPDRAKPYYEKLLKEYETSEVGLFYKLTAIITYLQNSGQVEKTYYYLGKFKELAQKSKELYFYSQVELLTFQSDLLNKKYESAIEHLKQHHVFKDSIFDLQELKQATTLQLQFETEKKDKNIKLLVQQGKMQEAEIYNEKVVRNFFIGSMVALVLFLALLYNRSRLKTSANKKLELKRKQIDEQNEQLKKLLAEKEWLLKEIHHRVKNNLQIVISLLNTQSAYLDNEDALMAIQNSQHRMHAMSLIHQKLYQSDNLSTIDMSWYSYELINYIRECYSSEKKIKFDLDVEKIFLDVAQAVPLGLIINEAVNNTVKYAFPDKTNGEVTVSFKSTETNECQLIISDNGVGLPKDFDIDETESLGMSLMRGLTEQIDGTFLIENQNGLKIIITFTKNTEIENHEQVDEISTQR
jgi:two-component sensor histidine kinase/tetratricopeptide (TPR) repeat protein